eukprot:1189916-Prorocentrum_minimum.AAC.1
MLCTSARPVRRQLASGLPLRARAGKGSVSTARASFKTVCKKDKSSTKEKESSSNGNGQKEEKKPSRCGYWCWRYQLRKEGGGCVERRFQVHLGMARQSSTVSEYNILPFLIPSLGEVYNTEFFQCRLVHSRRNTITSCKSFPIPVARTYTPCVPVASCGSCPAAAWQATSHYVAFDVSLAQGVIQRHGEPVSKTCNPLPSLFRFALSLSLLLKWNGLDVSRLSTDQTPVFSDQRGFARAGYTVKFSSSRSYFPSIDDDEINLVLFRSQEIPKYVEDGILDCGICGKDWVVETNADVVEVRCQGLCTVYSTVQYSTVGQRYRGLQRTGSGRDQRLPGSRVKRVQASVMEPPQTPRASQLAYSKATSNPARWVTLTRHEGDIYATRGWH